MKRAICGVVAYLIIGGINVGAADDIEGRRQEATPSTHRSWLADLIQGPFADEVHIVERELAGANGYSREELLMMFGRSSAASGRFDVSAAACAMFLYEFGLSHPHSGRVAMRLADALFPFKYDSIAVMHEPSGPRLEPHWQMGYLPRREHLQLAVRAYELAASISVEQVSTALFKLGWVHRVLGNWESSTRAWDRCAELRVPPKPAADALWLAAENLEWTDHPSAAADRIARLGNEYPQDSRAPGAGERVEHLAAEARRSAEWLVDPIASLKDEMIARSARRSSVEVYRSALQWLQRKGEEEAVMVVARWASQQDDWPIHEQIACRYTLVDVLLQDGDEEARSEAAEQMREIIGLAPDEKTAVYAAIEYGRALQGLGRSDEADEMLELIANRVRGSDRWEPVLLSEYAKMLLAHGNKEGAMRVLDRLAISHPNFDLGERLDAVRRGGRVEGGE